MRATFSLLSAAEKMFWDSFCLAGKIVIVSVCHCQRHETRWRRKVTSFFLKIGVRLNPRPQVCDRSTIHEIPFFWFFHRSFFLEGLPWIISIYNKYFFINICLLFYLLIWRYRRFINLFHSSLFFCFVWAALWDLKDHLHDLCFERRGHICHASWTISSEYILDKLKSLYGTLCFYFSYLFFKKQACLFEILGIQMLNHPL